MKPLFLSGGSEADSHRSKNVVQVAAHPVNSEEKANKREKNGLLCLVTTCCFLAGCVGSGKF